jgi:hypothetical protein
MTNMTAMLTHSVATITAAGTRERSRRRHSIAPNTEAASTYGHAVSVGTAAFGPTKKVM